MGKERVILHCDLNNFYASVECRYDPRLREVPMAVGGSEENRHGIVLAKNELAKQFGIKTAETLWQARQKCPELVVVPPHYERYYEVSRAARAIYARYTDRIEPFGIDECWLDMTGSTLLFGSGREIAERLRREVREELGVTISVGVSFNKVFAKLGSDLKKPDAVSEIPPDRFREIVWGLSAREMIGVGDSTAQRLESMGVYTIGQLARFDRKLLGKKLGKHGDALWQCANGEDRSPVALENAEEEVKSVGNSVTCPRDLQTAGEVWSVLLLVAESVSRRLREKQLCAGLVTVTIKDSRFGYTEHSRRLEYSCRDSTDLARAAMEAFQERYRWDRPVRAVGLRATELTDEGEAAQISLYSGFSEACRREAVESRVDQLRQKYGREIIRRGVHLEEEQRSHRFHGSDPDPMPTFHSR